MYKSFFKRFLDLIIGLCALPFVLVAIVLLGPVIWLEDKGPIFYKAKRISKGGGLFNMYKFRSMKVNAPDLRLENGDTYNSDDDPRVTKIGRFMRKTSIDEIPQFLNVLIGNMSFIGPRPDTPDFLHVYQENYPTILTIKSGITGYNQAYFRNSIDGNEKMKNDDYYAKNISFWLDIKIVFETIKTVLFRENINH
jgi:lipopolysaccharide/colanic/teichoic acid biosynthesis glycosyltransferase